MKMARPALVLACAAMLASCGGSGSAGGGGTGVIPTPTPTATPTPTPTSATCSLSARQDWAAAQLTEWYLFPDLLATNVNKASYTNLQAYIDALVAPARAQSRDRFFTYITSIAEENAFFEAGSSAGFGFRLAYDVAARRVAVIEAFEGAPALAQNIDRGSELLAIGTSASTLQTVSALMASGGPDAVVNALGPSAPGISRVLRVRDQTGVERQVTLTKTEFALDPVSDRFGTKIITDGGKQVGYINLRTFIDTADPDLRAAFLAFRNAGINELVIDLRYNGGGLISIAELMGDLMGRNLGGQVFDYITFRPSKASNNSSYRFSPTPQSIQPTKIAFITTGGSASASEMIINSMQPYLPNTALAIVGENTFGKPVGQIALDREACDDRLRVVALRVENANRQGDYYTGLASTVPNSCRAFDDISRPLGDPAENMLATALTFLRGGTCTPITATAEARTTAGLAPERGVLRRPVPDAVQEYVPGLF
ncbi:S41 family peptidase [Altererythrobacter lauratis]|uniref:S41 family peptidase n=1 Tax=Alteraurantiacibacter lauratis TaxID=2054627 RepID=A0ABV7EJA1_9SPHN